MTRRRRKKQDVSCEMPNVVTGVLLLRLSQLTSTQHLCDVVQTNGEGWRERQDRPHMPDEQRQTGMLSEGITAIPVSEKNTPFALAAALQSCGRNCHPAPDSVFSKLIFQPVSSCGGVFLFTDAGRNQSSSPLP